VRFTPAQVEEIRADYDAGSSITQLARVYLAPRSSIHNVISGSAAYPGRANVRPRGRSAGPRPELRKLSLKEEAELKDRNESTLTLARIYGISTETVRQIRKR